MFVQAVTVAVDDAEEVRDLLQRAATELGPGSIGWLGATAGVTDDRILVLVARFSSEPEARRNEQRPEQSAWYAELAKRFVSHPEFHDCTDAALIGAGGSDAARFVQVIQGQLTTPATAQELADAATRFVDRFRPDVLGGTVAVAPDGTVTQVVYFTTEEEARRYEAQPLPPEARAEFEQQMGRLSDLTYYDLQQPVLVTV